MLKKIFIVALALFFMGCMGPKGKVKINLVNPSMDFTILHINVKNIKAKLKGKNEWHTISSVGRTVDVLKDKVFFEADLTVGEYEEVKMELEHPRLEKNMVRYEISISNKKVDPKVSFKVEEKKTTALTINFHLDKLMKTGMHKYMWNTSLTTMK
jgi:hypothetical protein